MARWWMVLVMVATSACVAPLHMRPEDGAAMKVAKAAARVPVWALTLGRSEQWHARERMMRTWLGHRDAELVMAWGSPAEVYDAGNGERVWVYAEGRARVTQGSSIASTTAGASAQVVPIGGVLYGTAQGEATTVATYRPAVVERWTVYRSFRLNAAGEIIEYRWRGF